MALPKCHISGYVYDAKGDAAADVVFYVHLIIKDGKLIHDERVQLASSNADGLVEFDLPRDCVALISAPVVGLPEFPSPSLDPVPHKTQGGQALTVPDAATANLEDLLPAINAPSTAVSQSALNTEIADREQGDIDTLLSAKAYTNEQLGELPSAPDLSDYVAQSDLTSEATARASADTALQNNINSEASTRASADTTLQSNITAEATARASADSVLQAAIDSIPSPLKRITATIDLTDVGSQPIECPSLYTVLYVVPHSPSVNLSDVDGGSGISAALKNGVNTVAGLSNLEAIDGADMLGLQYSVGNTTVFSSDLYVLVENPAAGAATIELAITILVLT